MKTKYITFGLIAIGAFFLVQRVILPKYFDYQASKGKVFTGGVLSPDATIQY